MTSSKRSERKRHISKGYKTIPYFFDNKEVNYAVPDIEPGKSCRCCWHFHLKTYLKPDSIPPDYHAIELPEDQAEYRDGEPGITGFCIRLFPAIITDVPPHYGCPYHHEKAKELQFKDNTMTDDEEPYNEPIGRT